MSDEFPGLKDEAVRKFATSGRGDKKRTQTILDISNWLYDNADFREAVESPIGRELLREASERLVILHRKMLQEPLDLNERAEFDYLLKITTDWSRRIKMFLKIRNGINDGSL